MFVSILENPTPRYYCSCQEVTAKKGKEEGMKREGGRKELNQLIQGDYMYIKFYQ